MQTMMNHAFRAHSWQGKFLDPHTAWCSAKRNLKSLPLVAALYLAQQRRRYFRESRGHPYFGCFRSFDAARQWLPPSDEFDTTRFADEYVKVRSVRVFAYDYPVLYWLQRALQQHATCVLDIGGSVGVHFRAYRRYLSYPPALRWKVIEVPAIAALGARLAQRDGLHALSFADSLDAVDWQADVWLSSGAIHYIEHGRIPRLLERATSLPRYLVLNKLPLYRGEDFVTTQRIGPGHYAPLTVYGRDRYIAEIEAIGYVMADQWEVPERSLFLPGHPDKSFNRFSGLCFVKR